MRRAGCAPTLAALGIAVFLPVLAACSAAAQSPAAGPEHAVVFAVEEAEGLASHWITPVATVEEGDYSPVPASCEPQDAAADAFFAHYLAAGRSYPLLSGGKQIGKIVSNGQRDPAGTPGSLADLRLLGGGQDPRAAMATDSASMARPQSRRRQPTPAERRQAAEVATQILREHKVAEADLARLRADGLAVADLEGRGQFSLIATFVIPTPDDSGIQDSLFFVIKPGSEPTLLWYDHPNSVSQGEELLYVDQIPRRPGEPDDILVHVVSYRNSTYRIYRFHVIHWRPIFETPVYGCL
ncbi:MAG TPA: hypothetical protein VEG08_10500 [Terriglobales bacterium]|nr:hypothetical protein [Terriglobales bacterium]